MENLICTAKGMFHTKKVEDRTKWDDFLDTVPNKKLVDLVKCLMTTLDAPLPQAEYLTQVGLEPSMYLVWGFEGNHLEVELKEDKLEWFFVDLNAEDNKKSGTLKRKDWVDEMRKV